MDYTLEESVPMLFTTRAFATGIPGTLSAATVAVYEDVTATPILTSVAVTESLNSIVGLNAVNIAATAANGFNAGGTYHVVLEAGTVDSVSAVGEVVGHFTINHSAAFTRLGAPANASIAADLLVIDNFVDGLESSVALIPQSGGTTSWNATALAAINTEVDAGFASYDGPTKAELDVLGTTALATSAQVNSIGAASGAALNFEATSDNLTVAIKTVDNVGTPTGVFGATQAEDGSVMSIADTVDDIDHIFGYTIGGSRTATEVTFAGYLTGANDDMLIQAYDFVGSDWETIAQLEGQAGTTNVTITASLLLKHTGTGADLGNVYIRFEGGTMSSPVLVIDKLLVAAVNIGRSIGYANGAVYVDTLIGVAGTEAYVNGVADNPVNLWASAQTIATAVGIKHYHLDNGAEITLDAATDNTEISGDEFTIHFGGRSIANTSITHGLMMDGTFLGYPHLLHTGIGSSGITGPGAKLGFCALRGPIVSNAATNTWVLHDCWGTSVAASEFDFGAAVAAAQTVYITSYHGPIIISNMDHASDKLYMSGNGTLVISASSTTGTIYLGGSWNVTNNGTTTVVYDDVAADITLILADTADMQPKLGSPANSTISGDLLIIDNFVDGLEATIGVAGASLSDLGGMSTAMINEVNAAVDTALVTTTYSEPAGVPGEAATIKDMLNWLKMLARNKIEQTATVQTLYDDDKTTSRATAAISDDATTYLRDEWV